MIDFKPGLRLYKILIYLFIIQVLFPVVAFPNQEKVEPWDEAGIVEYRTPPFEVIESYRNNKDYNYDGNGEELNLFQRIIVKIIEWLVKGMSDQSWLLYVLGGVALLGILMLVLRLLNVPFSGLFSFSRSSSVSGLDMIHPAEGLSSDELERMLKLYRSNAAYREAVRVLYLMYLKNLHQKGLIVLKLNKTNRDYTYEIKEDTLRTVFRKLSRMYDYVWFGQFNIAEQEFFTIEREFSIAGIPDSIKSAANG